VIADADDAIAALRLQPNHLTSCNECQVIEPSGEPCNLPVQLLLKSVGYRSAPLPGVPFDPHRGIVPNQLGRVVDPDGHDTIVGLYVTGWLKRGPQGIIGTNILDAHETAAALVEDLGSLRKDSCGNDALPDLLMVRIGKAPNCFLKS
jgi:ferredoxin/flavodoxin---NADP+ reductase